MAVSNQFLANTTIIQSCPKIVFNSHHGVNFQMALVPFATGPFNYKVELIACYTAVHMNT